MSMNLSMWMFHRKRASPYLHDNVPLIQEGNANDASSVNSTVRSDSADIRSETNPRDSMMDQITRKVSPENEEFEEEGHEDTANDKQRRDLQLHGTEQHISTLQDLNELLYTRGRLQELGCTFSEPGELITYGGPPTLKESEQLLRLGPIYDAQWASFFLNSNTPFPDDDPSMWSDMRTLKRVLGNEGVNFDAQHRRLSWGFGGEKFVRLCAAYDDLQKLWTASLPSIRMLPPVDEREEEELTEGVDDSGVFMDEELDHELPDRPDEQHAPNRLSGVPRNIGWRFSDDIDSAPATSYVDDMTARDLAEMKEDVDAAVALSFPLPKSVASRSCSPEQAGGAKSFAASATFGKFLNPARPRHGPSRLQHFFTHNVAQREESMTNPRAGGMDSLELDQKLIEAANSAPNTDGVPEVQNAKKKSLKGWWKDVVSRRMNMVPDEQM